jgi:hypothetical protein
MTILVLLFIESSGLFLLWNSDISILVGPPEQYGCCHNRTIQHKSGHTYIMNRAQSGQAATDLGTDNVHFLYPSTRYIYQSLFREQDYDQITPLEH